jgi:hypothetical protein
MSYKRPSSLIDNPLLSSNKEYRRELIKTHALGLSIYDEGSENQAAIPFVHTQEDLDYLKAYEIKYL